MVDGVMGRFYVLSERAGVGVIDATAVDENDPVAIRFVGGATVTCFERDDLLWWEAVDRVQDGPFSNFGRAHHPPHPFGHLHTDPHWNVHHDPFHIPAAARNSAADQSRLEGAAHRRLVEATLACIPRDWRTVVLELKVTFELPASVYSITHRLLNPAAGKEVMNFSDGLFAAIAVFHRVELAAGRQWSSSTLKLQFDEAGRCAAETNFHYGTNFGSR